MKHRATVPDALSAEMDVAPEPQEYAEVTSRGRHAAVLPPTPDGEEVGQTEDEQRPEVLPAHVIPDSARWRSRHLGRTLLSLVTAAALVAVVPAGVYYWEMRTDERMHLLVVAATFAIGLWSILASRRPQMVCLSGSMLTIRGRMVDETFDLADALQRVELSGNPRKLRWSLRLARVDNTDLVLTRRDVDAIQLDPIVRYYRELAERRRASQWSKLGLRAGAVRQD